MNVDGRPFRTIWLDQKNASIVHIINQNALPHRFEIMDLSTVDDFIVAIGDMYVRGAGLIGATAGYGMHIAAADAPVNEIDEYMRKSGDLLVHTRPTAKNLEWAVNKQLDAVFSVSSVEEKRAIALQTAQDIADFDAESCRRIGLHGVSIIENISTKKRGKPVNILTHCNAGWLAFVDFGSATAPIYEAHDNGIDVHVWVDETRPRNQGASLTAWELEKHGVPYSLIVDNAGGHLMQHGLIDMVIVGSDRTTRTGDVANKIGTYLKAVAARDNEIPFYVALPSSTFDWELRDGIAEIPIEERNAEEVKHVNGLILPTDESESGALRNHGEGAAEKVLICLPETRARNFAFDVTPARLVSGIITERGICAAEERSILAMFPEKA